MPSPRPLLTLGDASALVARHGFGNAGPGTGRVGVELEWVPVCRRDERAPVSHDAVRTAAEACEPLPHGGRLTFEPGGQVELSTRPEAGIDAALRAAAGDAAVLVAALREVDVALAGIGLEPRRPFTQVNATPRYRAMAAYFATQGSTGAAMMCGTAAVQVNLDVHDPGTDGDDVGALLARWRNAHAVAAVTGAMFANSPLRHGAPTGLRSTRLAVWQALDPPRTRPVLRSTTERPTDAWVRYALDAPVMLARVGDRFLTPAGGPTLRSWIEQGDPLGFPDADDVQYHLTTLFPPVRPQGRLEVRTLDALPDRWWPAAVAITTALLDDPEAASRAAHAVGRVPDAHAGACHGLGRPEMATAARECASAALDALGRLGTTSETCDAAGEYVERFVRRGRVPADDVLDTWHAHGRWIDTPDSRPAAPVAP